MSLQKDKAASEAERLALHNEAVYVGWLRHHQELACDANRHIIFQYLDSDVPISEADLDFTVSMIGDRLARLSPKKIEANAIAEQEEINAQIEADNKRRLALSATELKSLIRAEMPNLTPRLPEMWKVKGELVALTAEVIRALPGPELKKLIRMFGATEVDKRLGVQKQDYTVRAGRAY